MADHIEAHLINPTTVVNYHETDETKYLECQPCTLGAIIEIPPGKDLPLEKKLDATVVVSRTKHEGRYDMKVVVQIP